MTTILCKVQHNNNGMKLLSQDSSNVAFVLNRSKITGGASSFLSQVEPERKYISGMIYDKKNSIYWGYDLSDIRYEVALSKDRIDIAMITIFD